MTPIPRRIGWLFMLIALGIAVAARQFGVNHYGPIPALVVVLLVGGIGVMLVFTDMMVRALYAQVESQSRAPAAAGAVAEGDALASQGSGLRRSAAASKPAAAGDALVRGDGDDVAVGRDFDRA